MYFGRREIISTALNWLYINNPIYIATRAANLAAQNSLSAGNLFSYRLTNNQPHEVGSVVLEDRFMQEVTYSTVGEDMLNFLPQPALLLAQRAHAAPTNGAPARGRPIPLPATRRENMTNMYMDPHLWMKAFPSLFPRGLGGPRMKPAGAVGFTAANTKYTTSLPAYIQYLLRFYTGQFAKNARFLFFARTELMRRCVSGVAVVVADRARAAGLTSTTGLLAAAHARTADLQAGRTATVTLANLQLAQAATEDRLRPFAKQLKGTTMDLSERRKDIMAWIMWRHPHLFHTLSSGDQCWSQLYHMIDATLVDENMEWLREISLEDRTKLLAANPVLAIRHFMDRFRLYLKHVVYGRTRPMGRVLDHWFRFEFQARGSIHAHGFLWVDEFAHIGDLLQELAHAIEEGGLDHDNIADPRFVELENAMGNLIHARIRPWDALGIAPPAVPRPRTDAARDVILAATAASIAALAAADAAAAAAAPAPAPAPAPVVPPAGNGTTIAPVDAAMRARLALLVRLGLCSECPNDLCIHDGGLDPFKSVYVHPNCQQATDQPLHNDLSMWPLFDLVKRNQFHICQKSCWKYCMHLPAHLRTCRFHFPKAVTNDLDRLHIAIDVSASGRVDVHVYPPRGLEDVNVNPYAPMSLLTWRANHDVQLIANPFGAAQYAAKYSIKDEKADTPAFDHHVLQRLSFVAADDPAPLRHEVKAMLIGALKERDVSIQEAAFYLLGHHVVGSSRTVVKVPTTPPWSRGHRLRTPGELAVLGEADENVLVDNVPMIMELYKQRPLNAPVRPVPAPAADGTPAVDQHPPPPPPPLLSNADWESDNEEHGLPPANATLAQKCRSQGIDWEGMSLAHFATWFARMPKPTGRGLPGRRAFNIECLRDAFISLHKRASVLRALPGLRVDLTNELFCWQIMVLHIPWRTESDLLRFDSTGPLESIVDKLQLRLPRMPLLVRAALERQLALQVILSDADHRASGSRQGENGDEVAGARPARHFIDGEEDPDLNGPSLGSGAGANLRLAGRIRATTANVVIRPLSELATSADFLRASSVQYAGERAQALHDSMCTPTNLGDAGMIGQPGALAPDPQGLYGPGMSAAQQRLRDKVALLNPAQMEAFMAVVRHFKALQRCESGADAAGNAPVPPPPAFQMFLSGAGGTGKTFWIEAVTLWMTIQYPPPLGSTATLAPVALMAPTGVAAFLIDGRTIHTALGFSIFGSAIELPSNELTQKLNGLWASVKLVVVDEISMVGQEILQGMHNRLSAIGTMGQPFGGFNIIFCGDLYQLDPVKAPRVYCDPFSPELALATQLWRGIGIFCEFTEVKRSPELGLAAILNLLRPGVPDDLTDAMVAAKNVEIQALVSSGTDASTIVPTTQAEAIALLNRRVVVSESGVQALLDDPDLIILAATNEQVERYNDQHVDALMEVGGGVNCWAEHYLHSRTLASAIGSRRRRRRGSGSDDDQFEHNGEGADGEGPDLVDGPAGGNPPRGNRPDVVITPAIRTALLSHTVKADSKGGSLPSCLRLTPGTIVSLSRNLCTAIGATNGAMGVVHSFEYFTDTPITLEQRGASLEQAALNPPQLPVVLLQMKKLNGPSYLADVPNILAVHPIECKIVVNRKKYVRRQLPIKVAKANTIHKAQGATLAKCALHTHRIRNRGSAYVGVSRCKRMSGFFAMGGNIPVSAFRAGKGGAAITREYNRLRMLAKPRDWLPNSTAPEELIFSAGPAAPVGPAPVRPVVQTAARLSAPVIQRVIPRARILLPAPVLQEIRTADCARDVVLANPQVYLGLQYNNVPAHGDIAQYQLPHIPPAVQLPVGFGQMLVQHSWVIMPILMAAFGKQHEDIAFYRDTVFGPFFWNDIVSRLRLVFLAFRIEPACVPWDDEFHLPPASQEHLLDCDTRLRAKFGLSETDSIRMRIDSAIQVQSVRHLA